MVIFLVHLASDVFNLRNLLLEFGALGWDFLNCLFLDPLLLRLDLLAFRRFLSSLESFLV